MIYLAPTLLIVLLMAIFTWAVWPDGMAFSNLVPRARADVRGPLSWLLWSAFGNDDDGIFWPASVPGPTGAFWRWWWRNKAHNLCFVTLRRRVVKPVYILGGPIEADEPYTRIVLRLRPFFLKLGPLFVGWRADKPNQYAWGGKYGPFGGAFDLGAKDMR